MSTDRAPGTPASPVCTDIALTRRQVFALAAGCGTCGVLAWAFWVYALAGEPAQDWMVFYTAARAFFAGNLPLLFDGVSLTEALNRRFASWLEAPLNLHPWVYPPFYLLLFLPFGTLPPVLSLVTFLLAGFAAAFAAGLRWLKGRTATVLLVASLTLCPAVPLNVMTGQNAFYTSALLVGGFGLLPRYPVAGGALLGVLTFKPQLWLMVPVALVAARQWRALAAATASASLLALFSLLLFGPDIWRAWISLIAGTNEAYNAWVVNGRLNGISVFACVRLLGAPAFLASVAQAAALLAAAAFVYIGFRRPAAPILRLAVLLAATILAAPHASASDAVLLALASSLYLAAPRPAPPEGAYLLLAATVWVSPLFNPPSVFRPGCITPLLLLLFLAAMLKEIRHAASPASGGAARTIAPGAP